MGRETKMSPSNRLDEGCLSQILHIEKGTIGCGHENTHLTQACTSFFKGDSFVHPASSNIFPQLNPLAELTDQERNASGPPRTYPDLPLAPQVKDKLGR